MFESHPNLSLPQASDTLWRYLDLWRFLSLLEQGSLWFSRLDGLEDPYEGFPPKPLVDDARRIPEGLPEIEHQRWAQVAGRNERVFTLGREIVCVSCWHVNPVESAGMWRLYAALGEGIAIKTTFEDLRRSFIREEPTVLGGMVRYVDFESYRPTEWNVIDWATLKRTSFEHEREFRAIVMPLTWPAPAGLAVPVDLDNLIAGVYVSPAAVPWYANLVRRVCARYDLKAEVHQSELLSHPLYIQGRRAEDSVA